MLLEHVGYTVEAKRVDMALDICGTYEKKLIITGRDTGATSAQFADYIMETLTDGNLEKRWLSYTNSQTGN